MYNLKSLSSPWTWVSLSDRYIGSVAISFSGGMAGNMWELLQEIYKMAESLKMLGGPANENHFT